VSAIRGKTIRTQAFIPSLTGLRFIAAGCVVISHTLIALTPPASTKPLWLYLMSSVSGLGMTLFFVLSGFVIHYTYFYTMRRDAGVGVYNFFVARFARLYPLYFVCLVIDLEFSRNTRGAISGLLTGHLAGPAFIWDTLPYYLTLTQSWFYRVNDTNAMIYHFGSMASLSWSISTEWFFYLIYPIFGIALARLVSLRAHLISAAILTIIGYSIVTVAFRFFGEINQFGISHFGMIADVDTHQQDSFFRWLVYFSPYSRLPEFLLGSLTASAFLRLQDTPPSARESKYGFLALALGILGIIILQYIMFGMGYLTSYHMSFGFAPLVAIVIFCCARYRNVIIDALGSRLMLIGGDCSYSIYLLHVVVIGLVLRTASPILTFGMKDAFWLGFILVAILLVSIAAYQLWERPARRFFRSVMIGTRPLSTTRAATTAE